MDFIWQPLDHNGKADSNHSLDGAFFGDVVSIEKNDISKGLQEFLSPVNSKEADEIRKKKDEIKKLENLQAEESERIAEVEEKAKAKKPARKKATK